MLNLILIAIGPRFPVTAPPSSDPLEEALRATSPPTSTAPPGSTPPPDPLAKALSSTTLTTTSPDITAGDPPPDPLEEALRGTPPSRGTAPPGTPPPDPLAEALGLGSTPTTPSSSQAQTAIAQYQQLAAEGIRQLGLTRNAGGYYEGPEAGWYYPQWNGEIIHVAPPPTGPPAPAPGTLGTVRVYRNGRWVAMPATSPTLPITIYGARLGLQRQTDGSFTKEGYPGSYYIMPNGSLYYTGGVRPREGADPERLPPKILTIRDGVLVERDPTEEERNQLPLAFALGRLGLFPNADGTFTHPGTTGVFRIDGGNLIYDGTGTPPGATRAGRQRYNLETRAWEPAPAAPPPKD